MLAKCPKCHEEIGYLVSRVSDTVVYHFDGEYYTEVDREPDTLSEPTYTCPWCDAELATSVAEAIKVLGR